MCQTVVFAAFALLFSAAAVVLSSPVPARNIGRHVQSDMILVRNPFFEMAQRKPRAVSSGQKRFDVPVGQYINFPFERKENKI